MKTKDTAVTALVPLNDELYTEFSVQELEERLETDPMMFAGLAVQGADCFECPSLRDCDLCVGLCFGECIDLNIDVL